MCVRVCNIDNDTPASVHSNKKSDSSDNSSDPLGVGTRNSVMGSVRTRESDNESTPHFNMLTVNQKNTYNDNLNDNNNINDNKKQATHILNENKNEMTMFNHPKLKFPQIKTKIEPKKRQQQQFLSATTRHRNEEESRSVSYRDEVCFISLFIFFFLCGFWFAC